MEAIVYIRCDPAKTLEILEDVKNVSGVKVAHATTGRFDILAEIKVADLEEVGKLVVSRIQAIPGVSYTETSMVVG